MARKFEKHFTGKDNAGLRAKIRETADGVMPACKDTMERALTALGRTVALTAAGRATFALVVEDYCAARKDYEPRCDCSACAAGSMQFLGAR